MPKLPDGYSEADYASLTPEEQAGLLELAEEERIAKGLDALEEAPSAPAPGAAPPTTAEQPDVQREAPAPEVPSAPPAPEPAPVPVVQTPAPGGETPLPTLYQLPADHRTRLDQLNAERIALAQKFDDGELTAAEYRQQDQGLASGLDDLKWQERRAQMSQEAIVAHWNETALPGFFAAHPEYSSNPSLFRALDGTVRDLQTEAIKVGGQYAQYDPAFLARAHEQVARDFGLKTATTPAPAQRPDLPTTLHSIPASDPPPAFEGGKFAALDQLTGTDYEAALARLSDAERDAYLRA